MIRNRPPAFVAWVFVILCLTAIGEAQNPEEPFTIAASVDTAVEPPLLNLDFRIARDHYLYAETILPEPPAGMDLLPRDIPQPPEELDIFSDEIRPLYRHDFRMVYELPGDLPTTFSLTVSYQGASEVISFLPRAMQVLVDTRIPPPAPPTPQIAEPAEEASPPAKPDEQADWRIEMDHFEITGWAAGFMSPDAFLAFLDQGVSGKGPVQSRIEQVFSGGFSILGLLLVLLGGLALNLTPCVLPLIPINLAIIGAGARSASHGRGFLLGGMYGLGMALAYGALGLFAALTGATFGALNASPWFNFSIAALFLILGLGMFGFFTIDLTRFGAKPSEALSQRGGIIGIFLLGAITATLAGACVAPVVISVLILSSSLYAAGNVTGILLPFVLGIGMALPWPIAGAGITRLPKPGKWMLWVKYGFAVLILLFAIYYGYQGYSLAGARLSAEEAAEYAAAQAELLKDGEWTADFAGGLRQARREGKPVVLDFWATWCKACLTMDRTTFRNEEVRERLADFVAIKYQAEYPNQSPAREVLEYFNARGLPTYVVLIPREQAGQPSN